MDPANWIDFIFGETLTELAARIGWAAVVAVIGFFGLRRRVKALEDEKKPPSVNIINNIQDAVRKANKDTAAPQVENRSGAGFIPGVKEERIGTENRPVAHAKVAEYITDEKEFRVGTKEGNMTIRLWDGAKTVEDVLYVLQKNGVLVSLDIRKK